MQIILSKKDKTKGLQLPIHMSADLAYFLGVLAGDGSINHRAHKSEYELKCVGNPKDEQDFYVDVLKPLIKRLFDIDVVMKLHDKKTTFGFRIYSKSLCLFLKCQGLPIGVKYSTLHIPKSVQPNYTKEFIRGLFDTDGCIDFKKKSSIPYPVISLSSRSGRLISQVGAWLEQQEFKVAMTLNRKYRDDRLRQGFSIKSRLDLNGHRNLKLWQQQIRFASPKHQLKVTKQTATI